MIVEKTYTPSQVAEILQVKDYTVREWLKSGQLKGINLNGRWRVKESALEDFMQSREK